MLLYFGLGPRLFGSDYVHEGEPGLDVSLNPVHSWSPILPIPGASLVCGTPWAVATIPLFRRAAIILRQRLQVTPLGSWEKPKPLAKQIPFSSVVIQRMPSLVFLHFIPTKQTLHPKPLFCIKQNRPVKLLQDGLIRDNYSFSSPERPRLADGQLS